MECFSVWAGFTAVDAFEVGLTQAMATFTVCIPHSEEEADRKRGRHRYRLAQERILEKAIELGLLAEGERLPEYYSLRKWSNYETMNYEVTLPDKND